MLCRIGLHDWRCTDWTHGDFDATGDACARPGCRRIRGTQDRLVEQWPDPREPFTIPPEAMGSIYLPGPRLIRVASSRNDVQA